VGGILFGYFVVLPGGRFLQNFKRGSSTRLMQARSYYSFICSRS